MSRENVPVAPPRAASLTGKKRPREPEADKDATRRTRSVGELREARDREAFQRQLIGVFVPRALKESAEGNMTNYNDLLSHFLPTPTQPAVPLAPLLPLVRALTAHVSLLLPGLHGGLVTAIAGLPWATGDERFVKSYVGLCGVIVSAHPEWTKEIVTMAVRGLTWQSPVLVPSTITRRDFHARHHLLLSHLLSLVPTLPNVLQPLLNRYAPHKREHEVVQTTWVRNCCELIDYCPELGARVWASLVDRMLRIDVEITNRLEDDEDDEDDDDVEPPQAMRSDPFELTISQDVPKDDDDDDDDSDDDDEGEPDPDALSSDDERSDDEDEHDAAKLAAARAKKREVLRTMRAKLDGMLVHFLRYLEQAMGARERGPSAAELAALSLVSNSGSSTPRAGTPRPGTPTSQTPDGTPGSTGSSAPSTATPALATRPPPSPAQSLAHFQTLLSLFARQILPTAATQHLPFVIFLCSSFSAAHTELLLHLLVLQALYARSGDAPSLAAQPVSLAQRVAATVYIGSLVCRARFVSDEQARTVMGYLLAYVDGKLSAPRKNDAELPLFYAVCQAAMLIFCFRWRAFTAPDDEVAGEMELDDGAQPAQPAQWLADLDVLQRALTSELNPLLGCNPHIVSTFAKVANATNFAYCFSIIEANTNATRGPAAAALGSGAQLGQRRGFARSQSAPSMPAAAAPANIATPRLARQVNVDAGLDDYFPFDPYDLPLSGEFIEHLYRTWDDVAVDLGGDSDSDDDDDDDATAESTEEDDDDSDELPEGRLRIKAPARQMPKENSSWHRHRDLLDGGISTSIETMNISPRCSGASGVASEA